GRNVITFAPRASACRPLYSALTTPGPPLKRTPSSPTSHLTATWHASRRSTNSLHAPSNLSPSSPTASTLASTARWISRRPSSPLHKLVLREIHLAVDASVEAVGDDGD